MAGVGAAAAARGASWALGRPGAQSAGPRASVSSPTHLIVLAHGLSGTRRDLAALERELRARDPTCLPLAIASNEGRTRDGVIAGAQRLAREVRLVAAEQPSLRTISFVGNSLGGLYVREAVRLLDDGPAGLGSGARVAGLVPASFVTIASPHLGVRSLFWVPPPVQPLAPLVVGQTARDLFLRNDVLDRLVSEAHLECLRRFDRRVLFANYAKDWMVPAPSAAIDVERNARLGERERAMAAQLEQVGWGSVYVALDSTPLPLAHNMICALSRDRLSERIYRRGLPVVREVAAAVLGTPGVWSADRPSPSASAPQSAPQPGSAGLRALLGGSRNDERAAGIVRLPQLRI